MNRKLFLALGAVAIIESKLMYIFAVEQFQFFISGTVAGVAMILFIYLWSDAIKNSKIKEVASNEIPQDF